MASILGWEIETEIQRGRADDQVFKWNGKSLFRLFALNTSGKLRDFKGNGIDRPFHYHPMGLI